MWRWADEPCAFSTWHSTVVATMQQMCVSIMQKENKQRKAKEPEKLFQQNRRMCQMAQYCERIEINVKTSRVWNANIIRDNKQSIVLYLYAFLLLFVWTWNWIDMQVFFLVLVAADANYSWRAFVYIRILIARSCLNTLKCANICHASKKGQLLKISNIICGFICKCIIRYTLQLASVLNCSFKDVKICYFNGHFNPVETRTIQVVHKFLLHICLMQGILLSTDRVIDSRPEMKQVQLTIYTSTTNNAHMKMRSKWMGGKIWKRIGFGE